MNLRFAEVAVAAPITQALTYKIPPGIESLSVGDSVKVPLGKRTVDGVVLKLLESAESTGFELKEIRELNAYRPRLPESFLSWVQWLAKYYCYPMGQTLQLAFPPLKRSTKNRPETVLPNLDQTPSLELTEEQAQCLNAISQKNDFSVHLLNGVTGSGKTEVYLQLFRHFLKDNKKGLFLVPEISLTPQLLNRFVARFGSQMAVLHSQLTEREKTNQWWDIVDGEKQILLGARSALFCPMSKVGLIVLDEEHENSFKQDEKLRYHARDAAIMLGKFHNCPVVLGSATPSLESWQNCVENKFHLHQMKKRISTAQQPDITVVDLRAERSLRKEEDEVDLPFWLSLQLAEKLDANLKKGYQSALFLNRRGMAQTTLCQSCGHTMECPNCDINLITHHHNHLVCHYCDYTTKLPKNCPECDSQDIETLGIGTELIEHDLAKRFPEARIARADRDEISSRKDMERLISDMEQGEIDILVGTQMIAKGLDFKKLTLVGLVLADVGFNLPDFRATEKSFQLITQMSGRAGRHKDYPGEVVIQTYNPEHPSIVYASQHAFLNFANEELENRKALGYPPFGRTAIIKSQAAQKEKAEQAIEMASQRARQLIQSSSHYEDVQVLGPSQAPLPKVRNKYRFHCFLKFPNAQIMTAFFSQYGADQKWVPASTKVQIDIDPMNML